MPQAPMPPPAPTYSYTWTPSVTPRPTSTPTPRPTATPTPSPTLVPSPTPTSTPKISSKLFGVNTAGAEFGEKSLPGTSNQDFIYTTTPTHYTYFAKKGLTLQRVPFRWERVQRWAWADLSSSDIASLRQMVDSANAANEKVILDMHNYGRYYNAPLTRDDTWKLTDAWRKIATVFKDHPALYGYEIMNEPHDLPGGNTDWQFMAQEVTNAIRDVDKTHVIIIPGYDWQSAARWRNTNENLTISDPSNNILYSAHVYFDQDATGEYKNSFDADGVYPSIGRDRMQPFFQWLSEKNKRGIITEYGVPKNDARWLLVLDNFMQTLKKNNQIVGGTYWASGEWWGSYSLSVEPTGIDAPQMSILQNYPSQ